MHEANTKHWPRVVDIPPFPSDVQAKLYLQIGTRPEWIKSPTLHPLPPLPACVFVMLHYFEKIKQKKKTKKKPDKQNINNKNCRYSFSVNFFFVSQHLF